MSSGLGFPIKRNILLQKACALHQKVVWCSAFITLRVINYLGVDQTSMIVLASNLCVVLLGVKTHSAIASSKLYVCTECQMNSSLLVTLNEMLLHS